MDARAEPDLPLAGMLGEGAPEHGLRGHALILMVYGLGAVVFGMGIMADADADERILLAALGGIVFAMSAYLAEGVRRFKCWAWFFVTAWLVLFCPAFLLSGSDEALSRWGAAALYTCGLMMAACIHYLWTRRGEFWLDARIEAVHRPPRWVTREWRAARLARMNTVIPTPRPAAPVPGALWTRGSAGSR